MRTLSQLVGQLFLIGFEGNRWGPELENLLRDIRPGGAIFFQRNITTPEEFQQLVGKVRDCLATALVPAPFLAVDLEGGAVDRLRDVLAPLPAAREAATAGLARELGRMAGRELASFSLNLDFAPVLDLATPESHSILGSRTVSDSPQQVVRFAEEFLAGLAEQGILGCGKHYPGLGNGQLDSHLELPCIEKEEPDIWREDLFPFRALAAQLPMIMVAHAWYPGLETALSESRGIRRQPLPASLSPNLVSRLLKGRIRYQGLVLSDDLEMGGVLQERTIGEAAVRAVKAGCDMLLVCRRADNVQKTFESVLRESERDSGFREQVEQAAEKVLRAKQTQRLAERQPVEPFTDWERLRQEVNDVTAEVRRRLSSASATREVESR